MINYLFAFVWGSLFGSFLTVVTHRIQTHPKSIINGRSMCPNCKNKLQVQDLVPIFSYLFYRGKCRMCENKIDQKYPIIELVTSLVFTGLAFKFSVQDLILITPLIILFLANVYQDALTKQVESNLLYTLCITSFAYGYWFFEKELNQIFIFGLIGFAFFYIQELISKKSIGDADAFIGLSIGFIFANIQTLESIFIAYWVAVLSVVPYFLIKYRTIKNKPVALIPFLFTGFYINLIF